MLAAVPAGVCALAAEALVEARSGLIDDAFA
jgi:hypothetical protein